MKKAARKVAPHGPLQPWRVCQTRGGPGGAEAPGFPRLSLGGLGALAVKVRGTGNTVGSASVVTTGRDARCVRSGGARGGRRPRANRPRPARARHDAIAVTTGRGASCVRSGDAL